MGIDWAWLGNLALNALISVLSAWVISSYYFRKVTRAEKFSEQITVGLQRTLFPVLYPDFFDQENSLRVQPNQPKPADEDVPFVDYALLRQRDFRCGEKVEILLKLRDSGFDLANPDGISVRDHTGKPVGVVAAGLGYAKCSFFIPNETRSGIYEFTIALQDTGEHKKSIPNHNVQTVNFLIR